MWEHDYITENKDNTAQLAKLRVLQKALKIAVHRGVWEREVFFALDWEAVFQHFPVLCLPAGTLPGSQHIYCKTPSWFWRRALMTKSKYSPLAACREKALSFLKSIRQTRKTARDDFPGKQSAGEGMQHFKAHLLHLSWVMSLLNALE